METYTKEMMSNLKVCKGCKRKIYLSGGLITCEKCTIRGRENREKIKQKMKEPENMCLAENCKYKKGENGYCGLHQTIFFVENAKKQGKNPTHSKHKNGSSYSHTRDESTPDQNVTV
jgi:hypothetical protein